MPGRALSSQSRDLHAILHLQRTIGNQAAQRLPESNTEDLQASSANSAVDERSHDFSRIPVHPSENGDIQAKLRVGAPGDKYEQEADLVADQVLKKQEIPEEPEEEEKNHPVDIQTRASQPSATGELAATDDFEERLNRTRGSGQPVSDEVRTFFEPRVQRDFSKVRVHTNTEAGQMNQELGARAFTYGRDIYFGAGQYNPHSIANKRLMAHELVHVAQQGAASRRPSNGPRGALVQRSVEPVLQRDGQSRCEPGIGEGGAPMDTLRDYITRCRNLLAAATERVGLFGNIKTALVNLLFRQGEERVRHGREHRLRLQASNEDVFPEALSAIANTAQTVATLSTAVGGIAKATNKLGAAIKAGRIAAGAEGTLDALLGNEWTARRAEIERLRQQDQRAEEAMAGLGTAFGFVAEGLAIDVRESVGGVETELGNLARQLLAAARCNDPDYPDSFLNEVQDEVAAIESALATISARMAAEARVLASMRTEQDVETGERVGVRDASAAALIQSWQSEDPAKFRSLMLSAPFTQRQLSLYGGAGAETLVSSDDFNWGITNPGGEVYAHPYGSTDVAMRFLLTTDPTAVSHLRDFVPEIKSRTVLPETHDLWDSIGSLGIQPYAGNTPDVVFNRLFENIELWDCDLDAWHGRDEFTRYWAANFTQHHGILHDKDSGANIILPYGNFVITHNRGRTRDVLVRSWIRGVR